MFPLWPGRPFYSGVSSADWCGDISSQSSYPSTRDERTEVVGERFPRAEGPAQLQVEVAVVEAEAVPQGYRQSPAPRPEYML